MPFKATALKCVPQNLKGIHYDEAFQVPSEVTCSLMQPVLDSALSPNCLLCPPTMLPWDPLPNTLLEFKFLSQGQLLRESNCKRLSFLLC